MTDYSLLNTSNIHPVIPKIYGLLYKSSWYKITEDREKSTRQIIPFANQNQDRSDPDFDPSFNPWQTQTGQSIFTTNLGLSQKKEACHNAKPLF